MIVLKEQLKNGLELNETINEFITKAKADKNEILVAEASEI